MTGSENPEGVKEEGFSFNKNDLLDLAGMAARFQDPKDPLSRYLAKRFRPETTKALESFDGSQRRTDALAKALIEDLNRVIVDSGFYEAKRFEHVALSVNTQRVIGQRPKGTDLVRFNTLLLEDAFPDQLLRNFSDGPKVQVERVQTGVRLERRMLKVLKALAEYHDMSLGELLEDIVLHAMEGVSTFDGAASQRRISALKKVYGMDYDVHAGGRFAEEG